jgi:glutamate-1-semialdehyde 2,1-aminomutase
MRAVPTTTRSSSLFERSQGVFPGGVNSPVRAFRSVGGQPRFIKQGSGSRVRDEDGNEYIDYLASWGPLILGHAHPRVVSAIVEAANDGTSFGAPTERELLLGSLVKEALPSIESLRFVNSGTEATMSAIRLARGFTGRDKVVKFDGCYHGHVDSLLVRAGSGPMTLGVPDAAGVPRAYAEQTVSARFNDAASVEEAFRTFPGQIAALIVEPIPGNMGVVEPDAGFLRALREITEREGALLIFDEVISGFRVGFGGAQGLFDVQPDLTCLGKILGGGLPVGAYGGRGDVMQQIAPLGPVYQAGTLSGNPIGMAAGLATLRVLKETDPYAELERRSSRLANGLQEAARSAGVAVAAARVGSMMTNYFTTEAVRDYESAMRADRARYARFHAAMLERGVYFAPSQFEAAFVSVAHSDADVDETIRCAGEAFAEVASASPA